MESIRKKQPEISKSHCQMPAAYSTSCTLMIGSSRTHVQLTSVPTGSVIADYLTETLEPKYLGTRYFLVPYRPT